MIRTAAPRSEPDQTVAEIRGLFRRSVFPLRTPTSHQLAGRLPALARLLNSRAGLPDREARSILEVYVSKLLELRIQECLSAVVRTAPSLDRGRRSTIGAFEGPGLALDA